MKKNYIQEYIDMAIADAKSDGSNIDSADSAIIVRACIVKYRETMKRCYGENVSKVIQSATVATLVKPDFRYFVELVVNLGERTANYVKKTLYIDVLEPAEDIDPDLSIRHIAGLADYITKDIILDIKVTNCINEKYIAQVLAYHYLSTKRDDVLIKKVIVYDATSDKAVIVPISPKNISEINEIKKSSAQIEAMGSATIQTICEHSIC